MSKQSTQYVRRNGSPLTTKQGPMKAVKAFTLKQSTVASTSEHSQRENHKLWSNASDCRFSPERSPVGHPVGSQLWSPTIFHHKGKLRPSSADTIVPSYLTGQWPKEIISHQSDGVFVCDKSAQTVELEKGGKRKMGHTRSASFGQGDQLQLQLIKHLHKSKESNKFTDGKQQVIPVPGSHIAVSLTVPPAICLQQSKSTLCSSRHILKHNVNRYQRNSVEGLNMEIEKLVSSITASNLSAADGDDIDVFRYEIPDGHRAPGPAELSCMSSTRNVDTQTPGHQDHILSPSVLTISRCRSASISPVTNPRSKSVENHQTSIYRSNSTENKSSKDAEISPNAHPTSPQLQKSCPFVREPPDGCEKVTVVEESKRPKIKEPLHFSPVKPNKFIFKASQGSAFCPLIKSYELPFNCTGSALPVSSTAIDE